MSDLSDRAKKWHRVKVLSAIFKILVGALCLAGVVLFLFLYLCEQGVPNSWVRHLTDSLSNDTFSVRIDRMTFSRRNGIHIIRPVLLYHEKPRNTIRLISADEISVQLSIDLRRSWTEWIQCVKIDKIRFPGVPESMRNLPSPPEPFSPTLPNLAPFRLELNDPMILGIHTKSLEGIADVDPNGVSVHDVMIYWHGSDCPQGVKGWVDLDFKTRLVTTDIRGEALPSYIVPIMAKPVLDAPTVEVEMNAFQSVQPPVKAGAKIFVNIDSCDYAVFLDIDAKKCTYKGIPVESLKGVLTAGDTNDLTTLKVGPLQAKTDTGDLKGWLTYQQGTELLKFDADSTMDLPYVFDMIELLNHGELDLIRCTKSPHLRARGCVSVEAQNATTNHISGRVSLPSGSILNLRLENAAGDFTMNAYTARFDNVSGIAAHGGGISGNVVFHFPDFDGNKVSFTSDANLKDIDIVDLASAANVTNERMGEVTGKMHLEGPVGTNSLTSLSGKGSIQILKGFINRMPIFAGFTDYLAKNVPGVSSLVDQSEGSMSFVIENGVMKTEDFLLEGEVFSLNGKGSYDMVHDSLNLKVQTHIFKKRTIAGKITRLVTVPISRFLLDFHVFGSLEKPDWQYESVIDKVKGSFTKEQKNKK